MSKWWRKSRWKPIESAPKDGTHILLKGGEDRENYNTSAVVAFWNLNFGDPYWAYAHWDGEWRSEYENPTHWTDIPE